MLRTNKQSSSNVLPVLGEDETSETFVPPRDTNTNRTTSRLSTPLSRRTPTPTKQIVLPGVRRKTESEDGLEKIDFEELNNSLSRENSGIFNEDFSGRKSRQNDENNGSGARRKYFDFPEHFSEEPSSTSAYSATTVVDSHLDDSLSKPKDRATDREADDDVEKDIGNEKSDDKNNDNSSSDDSDDDSDEEPRKAPNELFMEFLDCLMKKEYTTAAKLCKMILIYEPDNQEALKFQPVLEEKMKLDEEPDDEDGEESSEEESDDSGEEEDDSDDDDSDDDDDDEEEEDDQVNDSLDEFYEENPHDSGISGIMSSASD